MTRLYAGSRFVHQVVLSWATGSVSLWQYLHEYEQFVPDWGDAPKFKKARTLSVVVWALLFLAYVCLAIEDNSSWFAGIPSSEYVRVMTDIMDTGAAAAQREVSE